MTTSNSFRADSSHDVLRKGRPHPLDPIFAPSHIAVIGATEKPGSVGRTIFENLIQPCFRGKVFPVNPKRPAILGHKAYPSIGDVPKPIDLAMIVTPAPTVPGVVAQCAQARIPGAIIISAGFRECGAEGAHLEQAIAAEAQAAKMRLVGPNCLGIMVPRNGYNATFAGSMAHPGSIGFISQSGALCSSILDWSLKENYGFSAFISIGSMLDVGWGDLIYYLGDDPATKSIVLYMESIGDARSFLSAAREVALTKPIIVIKVGRSEAAAKAAASHTGTLTGSDEVLDAAFRRVGVLRVQTIEELFDMSEVLAKQPRPKGPRLAVITNGGGPGALATDMLISSGGKLADLSAESLQAYNGLLPPHWSHNNPVDILGDAQADRYAEAVEIAARDPNNDGLLVILTPQAMTEPVPTAERMAAHAHLDGKPILASWMGGPIVTEGEAILNRAHIPCFSYPDTAARIFCSMARHHEILRSLYETPAMPDSEEDLAARARAAAILEKVRMSKRNLLTEHESKAVLKEYSIPTVETRIARSVEEAVKAAEAIGHPVVLKLFSKTITHKTDVGGVRLNLTNERSVREAWRAIQTSVKEKAGAEHFQGVTVQPMVRLEGYELILGSSLDFQFGPVLLFGAGGEMVEVWKDRALGLPPLNATLARRLMERTKIYTALKGVRGRRPADLAALEQLLVRFSQLVVEQSWIKEIDINPLLVSPEGMRALDARIVLQDAEVTEASLPRAAIRPYPTQYVQPWKLRDGTGCLIRPIRPEDEPLMIQFHKTLSEQTVYSRYFNLLKLDQRIAHERLTRICFNDYDREIALVVEQRGASGRTAEVLGVGRLSKAHGHNEAEFAIVITDRWQGKGLGTELLKRLVHVAREEKLERLTGSVLPENRIMSHLCRKMGFSFRHELGEADCRLEMIL